MANMHGLSETSYNKAGRDGQMRLAHLSMEWQVVYVFVVITPSSDRPCILFVATTSRYRLYGLGRPMAPLPAWRGDIR